MEIIASVGIVAWVGISILVVCLTIAPLVIWRNSTQTNKFLLALIEEVRATNEILAKMEARAANEKKKKAKPKAESFSMDREEPKKTEEKAEDSPFDFKLT